jgi:protein disulfide-isomerase A6
MKFSTLSEYLEDVLSGDIDLSRATYDAQQVVFQNRDQEKTPGPESAEISSDEEEEEEVVDEIRIGEAGYGGFNPHEGLDMEELMKLGGGINPHAHHGSGHAAKKGPASDSKKKSKSSSSTSTTSEAKASPAREDVVSTSAEKTSETESAENHPKDEL